MSTHHAYLGSSVKRVAERHMAGVEKQGDRVDDLRQEKGQLGGEMLSSDLRCLPEPVTLSPEPVLELSYAVSVAPL
nr:hypothetical protein BaRGS_001114 [Batillaria attramentaria]